MPSSGDEADLRHLADLRHEAPGQPQAPVPEAAPDEEPRDAGEDQPRDHPSAEGRAKIEMSTARAITSDGRRQQPLAERPVAQRAPLLLQPQAERRLAGDPALHLALDGLEVADQLLGLGVAVLGAACAGSGSPRAGARAGGSAGAPSSAASPRTRSRGACRGPCCRRRAAVRSPSRRGRCRARRCRCGGPPPARAPAPGSCSAGCRGRSRPASWRASPCGRCPPGASGAVGSRSLARPKSRILAWPSGVTTMFSGLMSRWTMPRLVGLLQPARRPGCAISSAPRRSSSRPWMRAFTVLPSTNSIAMKRPSGPSPTS